MTAQHAQRQGKQVARNVAATLGTGKVEPYKHHDEGFLVDLGGVAAACNPLHVPVSGPAANAVTRGYHLSVMSGNRLRILSDWALNVATPHRTDIVRGHQRRVGASGRRQATSLTRPKPVPGTEEPFTTCSACGAWSQYGVLASKPAG